MRVVMWLISSSLVLAASQASQVDTPITSASAQIVRKPVDVHSIHLQNLRDVPLVEWKVKVGNIETGSDYSRPGFPHRAGGGPIATREVRKIRLNSSSGTPLDTAEVTLAVFADGRHEGTAGEINAFRKKRERLIDDIAYWQLALRELPRYSQTAAEDYLREKIAERLQTHPDDVSGMRSRLRPTDLSRRPKDWIFTITDHYIADLTEWFDAAVRYLHHVSGKPSTASAPVVAPTSVSLRTESSKGVELVVRIENLSDKPLEAWHVEVSDGRPPHKNRSVYTTDACVALDDRDSRGRIMPRATRDQRLPPADDLPDTPLPKVVLTFTLWNDLSWQGSKTRRDELLLNREERAAQFMFWIDALKEASSKASQAAIDLLRTRREERRRQAPEEGEFLSSNLEIWAAKAASDPQAPALWLDNYRLTLEKQHRLLTRHAR